MDIEIRKATEGDLKEKGILQWPIWEKEESRFEWFYDEPEVCYFLQGEVEVTDTSGQRISITAGDLVSFPKGLHCTWHIKKKVRKHYQFG